jgi:cytochrome b561
MLGWSDTRIERAKESVMPERAMARRYSALSIGLHWLMVLLFIGVYATIELREFYPKGSELRTSLKEWHYALGLSIFVLAWIRIAARTLSPPPANEGPGHKLAMVVHLALYGLMIGMPLAGWLILSGEGKPIPFFGLELPPLIGPNEPLADQAEAIHELVGTIGYYLIALHTAAALAHQYILRDGVLARMMPARARL